jgi:hypothetical protein
MTREEGRTKQEARLLINPVSDTNVEIGTLRMPAECPVPLGVVLHQQ